MEPALAREPQQAQQATWPAVDGWGRRVQADAAAGCGDSGWGAAAAEASAAGQLGGGWQAAVDVAGGAAGGCWGAAAVPSAGGWGAAHGQQGNVYDEGCVQGSWPALQACAQGWPASSGWESAGVRAAPGARQPGAWPAQQQATPGAATAAAVVAAHEAALGAGQLEAAPAPAWPAAGEAQGQPPSDLLLLQQAQQAQPVNMARQGQAFFMATDVHVVDRFWESLAPALQRLEVGVRPGVCCFELGGGGG
jgi:DNA polymerase-3 subunit gamma/tau